MVWDFGALVKLKLNLQRLSGLLGAGLLLSGCATLTPVTRRPAPPAPAVPEFTDATEAGGLAGVAARFVNWLDFDRDAAPDLLIDGVRLFRNSGRFRFVDVTGAVGLDGAAVGAAICFDFDNDGWTDIATTAGRLWHNECGQGFKDVARVLGFAPHQKAGVLGCGDVDGDGFADIYVGMKEDWNGGNAVYYPHQLWLNRGGRAFVEIGKRAGIDRKTYARAVLFSDIDGDRDQDIFVGNYRLQANLLWRNLGDGRFTDAARRFGVAGRHHAAQYTDPVTGRRFGPRWGHTIGACWLDLDNDGRLDLFTANLVHKYVGPSRLKSMDYDIRGYVCDDSAIYRRDGGSFRDWRTRLGVPPLPIGGPAVYRGDELWAGCTAGDANNDGWIDVFVPQVYDLKYATAKLFLNAQGRRFDERAEAAGIVRLDTYAGAWADIDADGLLDLATAGRPAKGARRALCLYRNTGSPQIAGNRWLKVCVRGGVPAATVLGTKVTVHGATHRGYREVSAGNSSYGQQNDPILHFGLGGTEGPVRVHVLWPDGCAEAFDAEPNTVCELEPPPCRHAAAHAGVRQ